MLSAAASARRNGVKSFGHDAMDRATLADVAWMDGWTNGRMNGRSDGWSGTASPRATSLEPYQPIRRGLTEFRAADETSSASSVANGSAEGGRIRSQRLAQPIEPSLHAILSHHSITQTNSIRSHIDCLPSNRSLSMPVITFLWRERRHCLLKQVD